MPNTSSPLSGFAFVGEPLERADALRDDADALARLWPGARILVLDQDGSAFTGDDGQPLALTGADIGGGARLRDLPRPARGTSMVLG